MWDFLRDEPFAHREQVMHIVDLPLPLRLLLCAATGIIIGFVLPPLSTHVHYSHKGLFPLQRGICGRHYCDGDRVYPEILWRNH